MDRTSSLCNLLFILFFVLRTPARCDQAAKTYIFRVDFESKPSIFQSHYHWYTSTFAESDKILHTYNTVFHGFSAYLTPDQADVIRKHPSVMAVLEDRRRNLHTTRSPQFLGLRNQHGLWSRSDYGSDIIIGIFDTGIWPERASFSDWKLGAIPPRWKGICETKKFCNRKIIGARFFDKGKRAMPVIVVNQSKEYQSPRDADGHGSHTASTAAGMYVFNASMAGYAAGIAKGVAPKARIAVYKVCWLNSGCMDSDILSAFDLAVEDGVDVISISIGGGDGISSPYYLDPIAIGSYAAMSKGIFVASSGGNDGPNWMSVTNVSPWITTVGASTIDRSFMAEVILGNGVKISGVSLYSGKGLSEGKMYHLVNPGGENSFSLCMENSLTNVTNKIVICNRGSNTRVAKGFAVSKAGGVGMILANTAANGEGLIADAHVLPACAVGVKEGDAINNYIRSSRKPTATIIFKGTVTGLKPAPVLASFSSRGPSGLNVEILKPDLIAPGVNILAAWTDVIGPSGLPSDTRKSEFNILSGTSMACPHVAGAAALLKSAHPNWSPAMIRSAMMTTATVVDNRALPMTDEALNSPPNPLDFGSGNLNLALALDPGLVYDISTDDYVKFLCSSGYDYKTIQVITRRPGRPAVCFEKKMKPESLNYPSMVAILLAGGMNKTFVRTVTNVGDSNAVYVVHLTKPRGLVVRVTPSKLEFSSAVKKKSFAVTISAGAELRWNEHGFVFGTLLWADGKHNVSSPIVVSRPNPM